jgi:hypothetical protein
MSIKFWSENLKERELLRSERIREDNIKIDLKEIRCGGCGLDPSYSG